MNCTPLWCQRTEEQENILTRVLVTWEGNAWAASENTTSIESSSLRLWERRDPHKHTTPRVNKRSSVSTQLGWVFPSTHPRTDWLPDILSPWESTPTATATLDDAAAWQTAALYLFPASVWLKSPYPGELCILTILLVQKPCCWGNFCITWRD